MIKHTIPGYGTVHIQHIVLDYNGTLAVDGTIIPGVAERLRALAESCTIHVITADTFGTVREQIEGIPCEITVLPSHEQTKAKLRYIKELGARGVAAIGNGRNDRLMLKAAVVGIATIQGEGAFGDTLRSADIVVTDIISALDLLSHPRRLTATLRS